MRSLILLLPTTLAACWLTPAEVDAKLASLGASDEPSVEDTQDDTDPPADTDPPVDTDTDGPPDVDLTCADADLRDLVGADVAVQTIEGHGDDHDSPCGSLTSGPDLAFTWRPPSAGCWAFDTVGSAFDTVVSVHEACDGDVLACNDDASDGRSSSRALVELDDLATLIVVADAASPSATGQLRLSIEQTTALRPDVDLGGALGADVHVGDNLFEDDSLFPAVPGDCPFSSGADRLLGWRAPADGIYRATLSTDFDGVLTLYPKCEEVVITCADGVVDGDEELVFDAAAGQAFVFRVAGYQASGEWPEEGTFTLGITRL